MPHKIPMMRLPKPWHGIPYPDELKKPLFGKGLKMTQYTVTDKTGKEISKGDTVTDFRGETATFLGVSRGPNHCGTAKVVVSWGDADSRREYYDRVFGLNVRPVE